MKEKIYTIPINESYEQNCECPFCYLEKKLEKEAVEYALGAAMMEPDYRLISNEKGYCNKHLSMLLAAPNKLSLALILETHLKTVKEKLELQNQTMHNLNNTTKSLFKKKNASVDVSQTNNKCVICDNLSDMINRYIEVFFYMWEKDSELKDKVLNSKGFCLNHFIQLCSQAYTHLKKPDEFIKAIYNLELENLSRIYDDIHKFTLKFDYRNKDMDWGTAIDAPLRTVEKLRGYIVPVKNENN